ncbi:hypothetical protein BDW02DRAFT_126907 [Decorospora gaudefroyi]|uniref:Uncharacterized protein n=1 Tax=Decorospora gaudefroyi TaxID=184978 RepID=A0A6A5K5Z7_9PLEO|nr:hypothetical protein BDW02DRAFT_126907 [Decorospora gaudefroyi]
MRQKLIDACYYLMDACYYLTTKANRALETAMQFLSLYQLNHQAITTALPCLSTRNKANLNRLFFSLGIASLIIAAAYHLRPKTKQKHRKPPPAPVNASNATFDLAKITPPGQINALNSAPLGVYMPRHAPLNDLMLQRTYQHILNHDLSINPDACV